MGQVSRPLQIALLATLLFAVAWFLVLRPKPEESIDSPASAPAAVADGPATSSSSAAEATGAGGASAMPAGDADATGAGGTAAGRAAAAGGGAGGGRAARRARRAAAKVGGPLGAALRRGQAVAVAFVDPRTADARVVREEIAHVSRFGGRAAAFSVPIAQVARYRAITRGVNVTVAPTVVVIAPDLSATTIVGFTDRAEIEQALADALGRG